METNSLKPENVKVLPLPDDISDLRNGWHEWGIGYNPTTPAVILNSYPDKVLGATIDNIIKNKLIDGEYSDITLPNQKEDELYMIEIDKNNELILTKNKLDSTGEPISRVIRNITTDEVSYNTVYRLDPHGAKKQFMPWEGAEENYAERKKGLSR